MYKKTIWKDQKVERPRTYEFSENEDGSNAVIDSFGEVEELGTPVNAENMNNIEQGIASCALRKYSATEEYEKGEWVLGLVNNEKSIFESLLDENINNSLDDSDSWTKVKMGGNSSYAGQTIFSLDPLVESGLHLLDGSLLNIDGIYKDFIQNYIIPLFEAHPERFITEESWQATVAQYGVCGKYVYTENVSVRLPKVTGFVEGTLDVNALGDIVPAGLPNITGESSHIRMGGTSPSGTGVFSTGSWQATGQNGGSGNTWANLIFNASSSNSIYGASNTVQPQAIKGYIYIVVGTSNKTDIEVDIDNIATDLNTINTALTTKTTVLQAANASIPDYSASIGITSGFTAPSAGIISVIWWNNAAGNLNLFINGKEIANQSAQANQNRTVLAAVAKNDVVTYTQNGNQTAQFFPLKGAI